MTTIENIGQCEVIYTWDNYPYIIEDINSQRYIYTNSGWKPCSKDRTPWN